MDKKLYKIFEKAVKDAKKAVLASSNVVVKNIDNIQTKADIIAQESIINTLKKYKVSCKIFSEELDKPFQLGGGKYTVVLDPLDGSFLYYKGISAFASICMIVLEKRSVECAFVQGLAKNVLYSCDNKNAYLNGKQIHCKLNKKNDNVLFSAYVAKKRLFKHLAKLKNIPLDFHLLNRGGSLLACMVASNVIDATIGLEPIDFHELTGDIIAQKAGAFAETVDGRPILIDPSVKQATIVANSKELLKIVQKALK